jgi:NAD(P)-dependent dehydrogenase (short-subunit alcohol dehydrogenase family)
MDGAVSERLLEGRTAIVTGASGGVGRGIAEALALAGAQVVIAARSPEGGNAAVATIEQAGGRARFVPTDIADANAVSAMVDAATQAFGGLDIVIHNASSTAARPTALEAIDDAIWAEQAGIAIDALHHLATAAFDPLKRSGRGRFIILSSAQGLHGGSMNPAYTALKAAQRGFVKALAREWGPHGILVNALAPAALSDAAKAYLDADPARAAATLSAFPLGRLGDVRDDIGPAAVAMSSDLFRYITGQTINVDGGNYTAL